MSIITRRAALRGFAGLSATGMAAPALALAPTPELRLAAAKAELEAALREAYPEERWRVQDDLGDPKCVSSFSGRW